MRVLFCGSRDWTDDITIAAVIAALPVDAVVIHGAARGADEIAGRLAKSRGLQALAFPAEWTVHAEEWCKCSRARRDAGGSCGSAGPRRNQQMLDEGKPTIAHAFPLPSSRGTWDMVRRAERAGLPVMTHEPAAPCSHPARNGRHEVYRRSNGSVYCRACGAT